MLELLLVNGALAICLSALYRALLFAIPTTLGLPLYAGHIGAIIAASFVAFPLHRQLEKLARRLLRRDWQAAQALVQEIAQQLGHASTPEAIRALLIEDLHGRLGLCGGALWVLEPPDDQRFIAIAAAPGSVGAELLPGGAGVRLVQHVPRYLRTPPHYSGALAEPFLAQGAYLLIPLRVKRRLIGIYGCGAPLQSRHIPGHIIELLLTIAPAAAAALENARASRQIERLSAQISSLDQLKVEFIESIAHELRTPLTSLSLATQLLNDQPGLIHELRGVLSENVTRLQHLIDRSLAIEVETAPRDVATAAVEIGPLLGEVLTPFGPTAQHIGRTLTHSAPAGLAAWADYGRLRRALHEIVDNAVRYGGRGTVSISAALEDGLAVIRVADQGPGIPPDEQPLLFDAFYRGRQNRALAITPGMGLGLSIARRELAALGGSVRLERSGPQGTVVTLALPGVMLELGEQERAVGER